MSEDSSLSVGLEIGDKVMILGGVLDKTIAYIYGFRPDRILIQPIGVTDSIKRIPLTADQIPDEQLGIQEIKIIRKVLRPGFVNLVDMKAGYIAETFGPDSVSTGTFTIESFNEEEDTAIFKTQTGETVPLTFGFMGIPEGFPFEVIRVREPPAEINAEGAIADEESVSEDEEKESDQGESDDEEDDFVIGNVVVLPKQKTIGQINSSEQIIQDVFQRQDLLSQLIQALPSDKQRDPLILQEIRRKVEVILHLRNQVVEYGKTGEPLGLKLTGVSTLYELLERTHVPLSRKVVPLTKVIYKSHESKKDGEEIPYDLEQGRIRVDYLSDIVRDAKMRDDAMNVDEEVPSIGLPNFFVKMESYRKAIQTPYVFRSNSSILKEDEEAFRSSAPNWKVPAVRSLDTGYAGKGTPPIKNIPYSTARFVKPRITRLLTKEDPIKIVEGGESPSYTNILLFPRYALLMNEDEEKKYAHSILREFGPIRSGSLAQDISLGMTPPELVKHILGTLGTPDEFPTENSILSFGVEGSISDNIELSNWLKGQNIFTYGTGDIYRKLSGYSLETIEFDLDQQSVINDKIKQTYAALRIFLSNQQEKNKVLAGKIVFQPQNLLPEANGKRLLGKVDVEPLLHEEIEILRDKIGEPLAAVDIQWFSYLYTLHPEYILAALGDQASQVAKHRRNQLRSLYLTAINTDFNLKQLKKSEGVPPKRNQCHHVKALHHIDKIASDNKYETRDVTRMKKYIDLLEEYRGETRENWIWCRICKEHLICQHELLLIQEYLRPKEKDILHKELLLHFSGGQFCGKFICKECGKAISELDFDTSVEFDDQGRPMMGRAVMEDKEEEEFQRIQEIINGPTTGMEEIVEERQITEEEIENAFNKNQELILMYKSIKTIIDKIGISIGLEQYTGMVNTLNEYLITVPTRAAYLELTRGEQKAQDYDVYKAIRYISAIGGVVLLFLQTSIPDFTNYYTMNICKDGYMGFPLDSEEHESGVECAAMLISSVDDKVYPWNSSTLQKYKDHAKRKAAIKPFVKRLLKDHFLQLSTIQGLLKKKREYLKELQGNSPLVKHDQISKKFRPVPYVITEEEAAKAPIFSSSSSADRQAAGWILSAHSIAKNTAGSSSTSGFHLISSPDGFWKTQTLPALAQKTAKINSNTSMVQTIYIPTLKEELTGSVTESDYYKIFMEVCYSGDNKGLPHELGIGLTCLQCGLSFEENPHLPTSVQANPEKAKQEKAETVAKNLAFLKAKGVDVTKETFLNLLTTSHRRLFIKDSLKPSLPSAEAIIYRLENLPYPPILNWRSVLEQVHRALTELKSPTETQIATAADPLLQQIVPVEKFIRERLPASIVEAMNIMISQSPHECMESLRTYVVVPFQRWIESSNFYESFKVLGSYKLSSTTVDDIKGYYEKQKRRVKGLGRHLLPLSEEKLEGLLLLKAKQFVKEISYININILPYLRSVLTPGGSYMVKYILRALVMGSIKYFMDPHSIPESDEEIPKSVDIQILYAGLAEAFDRFVTSNRIPSEKEIRTRLEERAEAEKQKFIGDLDKMSRSRKKLELTQKLLGIGKWAVGGTDKIRKYNEERYEDERVERAEAGIAEYITVGDEQVVAAQVQDDMFGIIEAGENVDDGYDHDDLAEEDY